MAEETKKKTAPAKEQDKTILETFAISVFNALVKLTRLEALEETIRRRTAELATSNQQLKELDKNKDQFISTATHELRTPLTSIVGYLDMVEDPDCDEETIIDVYIPVIKRNAYRLQNITDNLLDQQRINMNRLQIKLKECDFATLTQQVLEEMTPLAEEKNINIRLENSEREMTHMIDPIRVSQVITNLVDNAIKFSNADSVIDVSVSEADDETIFTVRDYGYGIRENDLRKLFKPFPGIDKPSRYRSTGLGLSISKGIIELHGGRVWATSEGEEKGAAFSFSLPKHPHRG